MKLSRLYFCLCQSIGLFYLVQGDTSTEPTKQETNSSTAANLPLSTTLNSILDKAANSNATEELTSRSVQAHLSREVNLTSVPSTTHPITFNDTLQQNNQSTVADNSSTTPNGRISSQAATQSTESGIPQTKDTTTNRNDLSDSTTMQNHLKTTQTPTSTASIRPTAQSLTDPTSLKIPISILTTEDKSSTATLLSTTNGMNSSSNGTVGNVVSETASGSLPTGASVALGIVSALLLVALLVIVYKYQRKFLHAFRFRRLQEVPMDDFDDDDGVADAIYAENTVPRIQFRV